MVHINLEKRVSHQAVVALVSVALVVDFYIEPIHRYKTGKPLLATQAPHRSKKVGRMETCRAVGIDRLYRYTLATHSSTETSGNRDVECINLHPNESATASGNNRSLHKWCLRRNCTAPSELVASHIYLHALCVCDGHQSTPLSRCTLFTHLKV